MTVNINGTTGVSLIQTGAVPSGTAVANGTFSGTSSFTGNVALSGTTSYININGINVSPYSGMMKNRIINGDMRIDQRFAGAANNNTASFQYVIDRWYSTGMVAGRTRFQQNNTNGPTTQALTQTATGFQNYFGANVITANASFGITDQYYISQPIEGLNIQDLNWGTSIASPVTLSFWVYSSIPGTHSGTICNASGARSYPFTYSINTANTWQQQIITVPGDTSGSWYSNNNVGMYVVYNLGAGSTYTASSGNSWQGAYYQTVTGAVQPQSYANGSFYITGVQLEKGSQATAFDFRHYTVELQLCQRYYYKEIPSVVNTYFGGCGLFYNTTSLLVLRQYPVTMRAVPTFSQTGTASHYGIQYGGGSQTCNAVPALNGGSIDSSWVTFYGTSFTAGQAGFGFNTGANQGYLAFSAELAIQN